MPPKGFQPMKRTAIVMLAFAALCSLMYARQKVPQSSKPTLDVSGEILRLGMTKAEVSERLAGNEIRKINENNWVVGKTAIATLQFTNARLTYADRYWVTYDNDIAEALWGAVSALNEQGFSSCNISSGSKAEPDIMTHNTWIDCGDKSILLTRQSISGNPHNLVYEQLGRMQNISH